MQEARHTKSAKSPSRLIDERIEELDDWRGEMLSRIRALIKEADPEVAEERKQSLGLTISAHAVRVSGNSRSFAGNRQTSADVC